MFVTKKKLEEYRKAYISLENSVDKFYERNHLLEINVHESNKKIDDLQKAVEELIEFSKNESRYRRMIEGSLFSVVPKYREVRSLIEERYMIEQEISKALFKPREQKERDIIVKWYQTQLKEIDSKIKELSEQ